MRSGSRTTSPVLFAAQHALFWLMAGCFIGLWLAVLLLCPGLNAIFGEFTYGRIVPIHLNFQLYGWTSLPLVAWLFYLFSSKSPSNGSPERGAVLAWSMALAAGGLSWLSGQSSGKIFLEWQGFPRIFFTLALLFLWCVLAARFWHGPRTNRLEATLKVLGLVVLFAVVPIWYWAGSTSVYPAVNPDTSGPTAASLLGSTLSVVLILLLIGPILGKATADKTTPKLAWITVVLDLALFAVSNKSNVSHRSWIQIGLLGSLLIWVPIFPAYFRSFTFPGKSSAWLKAFLIWFGVLTLTGWISFLPRILDSWKFTNALVAHSHLAMAGFVTSFNLFLLVNLLEREGISLQLTRLTFWAWNLATFAFVLLMWVAGTFEAFDPAFTILPASRAQCFTRFEPCAEQLCSLVRSIGGGGRSASMRTMLSRAT